MNDEIDKYNANLARLSERLPGYQHLCASSNEETVKIDLIDVQVTGDVHIQDTRFWRASSAQGDLCVWLTEQAHDTAIRYIVVEDLIPKVCRGLGAAFELDPQFFIDHFSNQGVGRLWANSTARNDLDTDISSPRWNVWNLHKPYLSFRWYRPVAYADAGVESRRLAETLHTEINPLYRGQRDQYQAKKFSPRSNIFRSELKLADLVVPGYRENGISAIEERVSLYQLERNGCKYVIVLTDPVPECMETQCYPQGDDLLEDIVGAVLPPRKPRQLPSIQALCPGFHQAFKAAFSVSQMTNSVLLSYQTLSSTAAGLRDYAQSLTNNGPCLEMFLYHIAVSDTFGFLQFLDDMGGNKLRDAVTQTIPLQEILTLRIFIAYLQSQLPRIRSELVQALQAMLELFPAKGFHCTAVAEVESRFKEIIDNLGSGLDSITGAIQYLESQRAITEAESISRLTELAFLFIPLSFAAALFSMQVRELAQPPPVAYFVAFALSLSVSTYTLRLLARSLWAQQKKEGILAKVRNHHHRPAGVLVSNREVAAWVFHRVATSSLAFPRRARFFCLLVQAKVREAYQRLPKTFVVITMLLGCILLAPSLGVLWTRQIAIGLRIGLTFVITLCTSCFIALVIRIARPTPVEVDD